MVRKRNLFLYKWNFSKFPYMEQIWNGLNIELPYISRPTEMILSISYLTTNGESHFLLSFFVTY